MKNQLQKQIAEFMASKSCCTGGEAISPATLPNSLMPVEVANQFIDETVDESVLLSRVRTLRVDHCQGKIPKLDLIGPVTEVASATACPTTVLPEERSLFYELVKYRSYFELETDFLECNLEGKRAQDTILGMFQKGVRNDSEFAAIQANSEITVGPGQTRINNLLGANDGWLKQICSCIPECCVIDAEGMAPSKELYFQAKRRIPNRFRGLLPNYRWITGPELADQWGYFWSTRTTDAGDNVLKTGDAPGPWGVPFLPVSLWEESMPYGSTGDPVTHIVLTPPENLIYIIGRQLRMERERVPKCDLDYWVMHWTADFLVEDVNKVVLIKNVSACGTPWNDCVTCTTTCGTNPCDVDATPLE